MLSSFNRDIVECKEGKSDRLDDCFGSFNRDIVECKGIPITLNVRISLVLIET